MTSREGVVKLGKRELEGLTIVLDAGADGLHSHWMPGTMAKLEKRGLISKKPAQFSWHRHKWILTDAGRAALTTAKKGE